MGGQCARKPIYIYIYIYIRRKGRRTASGEGERRGEEENREGPPEPLEPPLSQNDTGGHPADSLDELFWSSELPGHRAGGERVREEDTPGGHPAPDIQLRTRLAARSHLSLSIHMFLTVS